MFKTLFAIAIMSGSLSVLADDYYDSPYSSGPNSSSDSYQDTTSSSMSSTTTTEPSTYSSDQTVTGTMGAGEAATERYNELHVGFLGGINTPEGSQTTASSEFGLDLGYQPTSLLGVGVEASTTQLDRTDQPRRTMGLLKATTRLGGEMPFIKDFFVGAGAGAVVTESKWRIGGGPLLGFDIPITGNRSHDYLSLGANAKYIFTKDTPDSLISAVALKYWF